MHVDVSNNNKRIFIKALTLKIYSKLAIYCGKSVPIIAYTIISPSPPPPPPPPCPHFVHVCGFLSKESEKLHPCWCWTWSQWHPKRLFQFYKSGTSQKTMSIPWSQGHPKRPCQFHEVRDIPKDHVNFMKSGTSQKTMSIPWSQGHPKRPCQFHEVRDIPKDHVNSMKSGTSQKTMSIPWSQGHPKRPCQFHEVRDIPKDHVNSMKSGTSQKTMSIPWSQGHPKRPCQFHEVRDIPKDHVNSMKSGTSQKTMSIPWSQGHPKRPCQFHEVRDIPKDHVNFMCMLEMNDSSSSFQRVTMCTNNQMMTLTAWFYSNRLKSCTYVTVRCMLVINVLPRFEWQATVSQPAPANRRDTTLLTASFIQQLEYFSSLNSCSLKVQVDCTWERELLQQTLQTHTPHFCWTCHTFARPYIIRHCTLSPGNTLIGDSISSVQRDGKITCMSFTHCHSWQWHIRQNIYNKRTTLTRLHLRHVLILSNENQYTYAIQLIFTVNQASITFKSHQMETEQTL